LNQQELETYLREINDYEKEQRKTGTSINNIPNLSDNGNDLFDSATGHFRLPKAPFFQGNQVYIAKHNRFGPMIEHIHDFIEINYVYSGECTQYIKGQKILLTEGDFCVLDRDVPHSIDPLKEDDLLINILINDQTFTSLFCLQLERNNSLIGNFLATAFDEQAQHDQFLLFHTSSTPHLHTQVQLLLQEYWRSEVIDFRFISQYLQLILSELMRLYTIEVSRNQTSQFNALDVLEYIDEHYQSVSLNELSQVFNFNANYISNALKKGTGKNFQETLLQKRLLVAKDLLLHSTYSIEEIAATAGFHSTSYFYRQFKRAFQMTPKSMRSHGKTH